VLCALYLLLWPVEIDPVAWQAPPNPGLTDPFEANDRLRSARTLEFGSYQGLRDLALGNDGYWYASASSGHIVRFRGFGAETEIFATVGGHPLGIEFDEQGRLLVANASIGVQRLDLDGGIELLSHVDDDAAIRFASDVAVGANGVIYVSDSSANVQLTTNSDRIGLSLTDIVGHRESGRILRLIPGSNTPDVLLDELQFANGIAISEEQNFLVIAETGNYRILRHWLSGDRQGQTEVLVSNLPGLPGGVSNGLQGKFWVGMFAERNKAWDALSDKPLLRKIRYRLPANFRPRFLASSHVLAISEDGHVLMNLQGAPNEVASTFGVVETRNALWLTTPSGPNSGWFDKRDLATQ